MAGKKVLVVDDVGFNRLVVTRYLTALDYDVLEASSAQEGLTLLSKNRCVLTITDLRMPGMDGFEFIREARASAFQDDLGDIPCPPFILCTAHGGSDVVEAAFREGFADVIMKPVDATRLKESVNSALTGASEEINVIIAGNAATFTDKLAEKTHCTPSELTGLIFENLSRVDILDQVNSVEDLETLLKNKLTV